MTDLSSCSLDDLLAEVVRRRNEQRAAEGEELPWCDDCAHFRLWTKYGDPPRTYNPCARGHEMEFKVPEDWEPPETFGYFRRICVDRRPRSESPDNWRPPLGGKPKKV